MLSKFSVPIDIKNKHIAENGTEFWYARELMPILQYSNWQNFEKIIQKAKIACENSSIAVIDHFTDVNKMVQIGSEDLPTPKKSLKQLEKEKVKQLKNKN